MKYTIISAETTDRLERKVNDGIGLGWRPYGSIAYNADERLWLQPMVKEQQPAKKPTKLTGR